MSNLNNIINQMLRGFRDLSEVSDPSRFQEDFLRLMSELPSDIQDSSTFFDDNTEALPIEERLQEIENTLGQMNAKLISEPTIPGVFEAQQHVEPFEIEYGVQQGEALDTDLDHIDIKPSGIDGTLNTDLGQIAIGVSSDGKNRHVTLASGAVVKFLRLERPVATVDSTTTIYGIMLGSTSLGGDNNTGPMNLASSNQYTFDITGDEAWHDVVTDINLRNTTVIGVAYYDAGAPVTNGDPKDDNVTWYNTSAAGFVNPGASTPGHIYVTGNAATVDMMQIIFAGRGDFTLRVGADGGLEARVENYTARFFVQVWLFASGLMTQGSAISIS